MAREAQPKRFQVQRENYAHLETFEDEILIECSRCQGCAVIHESEEADPAQIPSRRNWVALCSHCPRKWRIQKAWDSWKTLPLWLKTRCAGNVVWAYNQRHLSWLEAYVGATLREDKGFPSTRALHGSLPRWMISGKNRDDVLRALRRLRTKLKRSSTN